MQVDISGQRFGALVAVRPGTTDKHGSIRWVLRCDCGNEVERLRYNIRDVLARGFSPSCGCVARVKHRMYKHPAYSAFHAAVQRCTNPSNPSHKNYGGRGITMCKRWVKGGFEQFWKDIGVTWQPGLTLDRIDNNKGYTPKNCRWATMRVQLLNQRRKHTALPVDLHRMARDTGLKYETLRKQYHRNVLTPQQLAAYQHN